jgi:hypothetical protein
MCPGRLVRLRGMVVFLVWWRLRREGVVRRRLSGFAVRML